MGNEVPATKTPETEAEAVGYCTSALTLALGTVPPEQILVWTMALFFNENARGNAIIQHNIGNVSCYDDGRGWSGDYWRPPWYPDDHDPKYDALHAKMLNHEAPSAFRAYPNPEAGWASYVHEVVRRKPLVDAMLSDDPLAFVRALVSTGYAPEYVDSTAPSMASLAQHFRTAGYFSSFPKGTSSVAVSPTAKKKVTHRA